MLIRTPGLADYPNMRNTWHVRRAGRGADMQAIPNGGPLLRCHHGFEGEERHSTLNHVAGDTRCFTS